MGGSITSHTVPSSATTGQVINATITIYNNTGAACYIGTSWDANTIWDYIWCAAGASVTLQPGQITMPAYNVTMNLYAFSSPDGGTWSIGDSRSIPITNSSTPSTPQAKGSIVSIIAPATAAVGETISIGANIKNTGTVAGTIGISIGGSGIVAYTNVAASGTAPLSYDYGMPSGGINSVVYVYHQDSTTGTWVLDGSKAFTVSVGTSSYPKATFNSVTLPSSSQSPSNAWIPGTTSFTISAKLQNTGAAGYMRAIFTPDGCAQVVGSASSSKIATNAYYTSTATITCPYPGYSNGQTGYIQIVAQSKTDLIDWMSDSYYTSSVIAGGYTVPQPICALVSVTPSPSSAPPNSAVTVAVVLRNTGTVSGYIGYGIVSGTVLGYNNVAAGNSVSLGFGYGMPASGAGGGTVYYYHKDVVTGSWVLDGSLPWTVAAGAKVDFTLTVNVTGTGTATLSPVKTTYKAGDIVTVITTPGAGYVLTSVTPASPITVTGDTTISVLFSKAPASVFTANRVATGTVSMLVTPVGTSYLARVYVSQGGVEKASSPTKTAVVSTSVARTDTFLITWPTVVGTYDEFIEIIVGTTKIKQQIAGGITVVAAT